MKSRLALLISIILVAILIPAIVFIREKKEQQLCVYNAILAAPQHEVQGRNVLSVEAILPGVPDFHPLAGQWNRHIVINDVLGDLILTPIDANVRDDQPSVSTITNTIVFTRSILEPYSGASIWVMGIDGSNQRQLSVNPKGYEDSSPRFSSDGKMIIFVRLKSVTGSNGEIMVINSDGTNLRSLPSSQFGANEASFVDQDTKITFVDNRVSFSSDGGPITLVEGHYFVMNVDGSELREISRICRR